MVIIQLMRPQIPSHKVIIISSFHCNSILGNFFLYFNVLEENLPPYVQKYPISLENWTKLIWRETWDFVCSKNLTPSLFSILRRSWSHTRCRLATFPPRRTPIATVAARPSSSSVNKTRPKKMAVNVLRSHFNTISPTSCKWENMIF